jgi:uncharacterized protein YyaL (SSP411 family)
LNRRFQINTEREKPLCQKRGTDLRKACVAEKHHIWSEYIAKLLFVLIVFVIIADCALLSWVVHGKEVKMVDKKANRLINEKSPYLLQHAHNPVDWYPWSNEAFEKAKKEDKPIFLSIGYSTCHWCHVMEKESFEDPEVAKLMNETFVSIKVDREERPDLDQVYMTVCQILTGSGGWPLTIIMTPEKKPFFAATYVPKGSRFGRTGMMELIPRIKQIWETRRDEVFKSADSILNALQSMEKVTVGEDLDRSVLDKAYEELAQRFDKAYGGFSNAPKFPTPHNFLFMLRYWKRTGNEKALEMTEKTLEEMRRGGVYDQVGYGFHRYSTDREWLVPHFEKMLYDQAMLALAYLETYQATGKEIYANTAREIFAYVIRDMTSPQGGFYSAEDADSEGVEGKFYVWTEDEIRKMLAKQDAELILRVFNVEKDGNFTEEATGRKTGANILHLKKPIQEIASDLQMSEQDLEARMRAAKDRLFEIREKRIHPHKDDKILADWNGLMIAALARGARVLIEPKYAESAKHAVAFILDQMRRKDGRLLHRYRDGEAKITAHLDDYAFMVWGLIELYEATFEARYLKTALELNADMLKHYWDQHAGGLFFTPADGEKLIVRKKELYDGAVPSGNSVAMFNLLRLSRLTADSALDDKADKIGRAFSEQVKQFPSGYTQLLVSVDFAIGPSYEIVIVGHTGAEDTSKMIRALDSRFIPNRVTLFRPSDHKSPDILSITEFINSYLSMDSKATAYVCLENACKTPTTDTKEMLNLIK